jgi:transcriptional regulator of acetoin/glycerol metabolism
MYLSPVQPPEETDSGGDTADDFGRVMSVGLELYLDSYERRILQKCINTYQGTLDEMARQLKVSRPTLYRRLKRHRISSPREEVLH